MVEAYAKKSKVRIVQWKESNISEIMELGLWVCIEEGNLYVYKDFNRQEILGRGKQHVPVGMYVVAADEYVSIEEGKNLALNYEQFNYNKFSKDINND